MRFILLSCALHLQLAAVSGFWDDGTSTVETTDPDILQRPSFFRWREAWNSWVSWFYPYADWDTMALNRRTVVVAGISIDFLCIGTATLLNRRTLITAANLLDPYYNRQRDLRIWALGNRGYHNTPYRYRVWRVTRLFPKSLNPEHWHGPHGVHSPRHDISIIHSLDQIFILKKFSTYGTYPYRSFLCMKHKVLSENLWIAGSGFQHGQHVKDNYKIYWYNLNKADIVDCSRYLPKYWGKFICVTNTASLYGIQNGMGFHSVDESDMGKDYITALGCFEIRYNEERVMVFTDLRYYVDWILTQAYITVGEYYEYAYPQWGTAFGYTYNSYSANAPRIPDWQKQYDLDPIG